MTTQECINALRIIKLEKITKQLKSSSFPPTSVFPINVSFLRVLSDLGPPLVKLVNRTQSSLSLQISDSPGLQATEYFITYWRPNSLVKNLTIERNPSGLTRIHLTDLNSSSSYNVQVVARNEPYHSQPANNVFATLNDNDCELTLQQVRADPLAVNWTYVCKGSQKRKEITSYVIVYESPTDYRRFSVEKVVTNYRFCELHFNTTYNLSVTAVAQNGIPRESNILSLSIDKYSDEVPTVEVVIPTEKDTTGLIVGVAVLGILFATSGLVALYSLLYIRRLAMIYMVHIFMVRIV